MQPTAQASQRRRGLGRLSQRAPSTWYLLVELKGISATFLLRSRISFTEPEDNSMHFSRADSEASPATSLWGERAVRAEQQGRARAGQGGWQLDPP